MSLNETQNFHPGEIIFAKTPVVINRGRRSVSLVVKNTGDRPIQVGSHFHFFEVNKALDFKRANAFGMHLNIQAGTCVRFEPGDEKEISLVEFGGKRKLWGFNDLTRGDIRSKGVRNRAMRLAKKYGYKGVSR
jgi:urease beta subunit